jgi:hypothetical protein
MQVPWICEEEEEANLQACCFTPPVVVVVAAGVVLLQHAERLNNCGELDVQLLLYKAEEEAAALHKIPGTAHACCIFNTHCAIAKAQLYKQKEKKKGRIGDQ